MFTKKDLPMVYGESCTIGKVTITCTVRGWVVTTPNRTSGRIKDEDVCIELANILI